MSFIKAKDLNKIKRSYLEEIKNPKYEDLLDDNIIVEFKNTNLNKIYHGIILNDEIRKNFTFRKDVILTPNTENYISYWSKDIFYDKFPICESDPSHKIIKIYKLNKDTSKLKTSKELYDLFKEFNLKFYVD